MFEEPARKNRFYVGASRAKHYLDFVSILPDEALLDLTDVLTGKRVENPDRHVAEKLQVKICRD